MDLNSTALIATILTGIPVIIAFFVWIRKKYRARVKERILNKETSDKTFTFQISLEAPIDPSPIEAQVYQLIFHAKADSKPIFVFNIEEIALAEAQIHKIQELTDLSDLDKSKLSALQNYYNHAKQVQKVLQKGFEIVHNKKVFDLITSIIGERAWTTFLHQYIILVLTLMNQNSEQGQSMFKKTKFDVFDPHDTKRYFGIYLSKEEIKTILERLQLESSYELTGNRGYDVVDLGGELTCTHVLPRLVFEYVVNLAGTDPEGFYEYGKNIYSWKIGIG